MRVTENLLSQKNRFMARRGNRMRRKIRQADHVAVEPLAVRLFGSDFVLQLRVVDDASFTCIDQKHLSGLQAAFEYDVFCRNIEHTDF